MVGVVADLERLVMVINVERTGAAHADLAHLAGNESGVRTDAAACGENALGRDHAAQVFGRCLDADEEDFFTFVGGFDATFGIEVDFAGGRAGTGGEPFGNDLGRFDRVAVEDGREDLIELLGRHAVHGGFPVDEFFFDHVAGDFHSSETGAFAVAGLQHEKLAVFDGELEVLHVCEVLLEGLLDLEELAVGRRELFFHADDRFRRAHPGHDVFTLRVDEELAVEDLGTAGRVAREGDAGTTGVAHVAEDHALHVDRRAPLVRDVVFAAVDIGALVVPRAEDRADRAHELLAGIIGESFPGALFDQGLEAFDHLLQRLGVERGVANVRILREKFGFEFFNDRLKRLVLLARTLLHTHDDVAIHLDETAVAVVGETLVVGQTRQTLHRGVVEAEVEDGVHHARHGIAGAGTHGDEQRVLHAAEFFAHGFLHFGHGGVDLCVELLRVGALVVVVVSADFGADGEAAGHGKSDARHFAEVGAFAAEQRFHRAVAVRFSVTEIVNVFAFGSCGRLCFFAALFLRGFAHECG